MASSQPSIEPNLDDPWDWSVNQVVARVCEFRSRMLRRIDPLSIPNHDSLVNALRDNAVNGSAFLIDLNHSSLRNDLGIIALGQRTTIMQLVLELRLQSLKYRQFLRRQKEVTRPSSTRGATVSTGPLEGPQHKPTTDPHLRDPHESPKTLRGATTNPVVQDAQQPSVAPRRQSETIIVDDKGRKRRRLVLAPVATGQLETVDDACIKQAHEPTVLPEENGPITSGHMHDAGEWDDLKELDSMPSGDDILPIYGESGSENEYDLATWKEIEKERGGIWRPLGKKINSQEVQLAIDEATESTVQHWTLKRKPKLLPKAWRLWTKVRENGTLRQEIERWTFEIQKLDARLSGLQEKIMAAEWLSAKQVTKQCKSMENSIYDREEFKWKVSTVQQISPPERLHNKKNRVSKDSRPGKSLNIHVPDADDMSNGNDNIKMEGYIPKATTTRQRTDPFVDPSLPKDTTIIDLTQEQTSSDVEVSPKPATLYVSSDKDPSRRARKKPALFKPPPAALNEIQTSSNSFSYSTAKETTLSSDSLNLPDFSEVAEIRDLRADMLTERKDRKRTLIWVIDRSSASRRLKITHFVRRVPFKKIQEMVWLAFEVYLREDSKIRGLHKEDSDAWMLLAAWYVCWIIPVIIDQHAGISLAHLEAAEADHKGFVPFFEFLGQCLRHYESDEPTDTEMPDTNVAKGKKRKRRKLQENSDDLPEFTPSKKRKRVVSEREETIALRKKDQIRVYERERRQQEVKSKLQAMGVNEDSSTAVVNTGKHDNESFIHINPGIASRMQPHQMEGVQFMWREIVAGNQGCLLAQTMGLGKTMQVITLLVTIAEAAKSPDENIRNQVPDNLRQSRTLILCPPALVENWWDEVLMWTPLPFTENIGEPRKVSAAISFQDRLYEIERWEDEGGVLIMGLNTFRHLILNQANKPGDRRLDDQTHTMIKFALLHGPNLIVIDEAHHAKNVASGFNKTISCLKSKNRIALTGSPLANNLEEYHSLIDWIAPKYLGTWVEFKANYAKSIEEGLYQDSTQSQYRQSLKLLEVLKSELQPKVHRADISALRGKLPEMQEFVIRVPLTNLQEVIYGIFVHSILSAKADDKPQAARMFSWINTLRLLCNHPSCLQNRLLEGIEKFARSNESNKNDGSEDTPEIPKLGISQTVAKELLAPFKDLTEAHDSISLSNKMQILMDIIEFSKEVHDKVLVFSNSIYSLNFIENQMNMTATKYSRIDGDVKPSERVQITKDFNNGPLEVCLVSTRAGGQGLNLYGANRVIILDDHFNPMHGEQAVGRAYRIGQIKPVFVYQLTVGGTFEDLIHNQSLFKQQLARRVVDKENPRRQALKKIGEYLFLPKEVEQRDLGQFIGKDPYVLDRILDAQNVYVCHCL